MMNILRTGSGILRRVFDGLLLALILVVLVGILLGKGVPLTGRETIVVGGASMEPAIGLGSAIVIKPVAPADLAIGDVVTLKAGPTNAIYTHRIISLVDRPDGRWLRTQGDANAEPDPTLIPASAIVGRMELVIPLAGYLLAVLSIPSGVIFLIALAVTLLACAWLLETLELEPAPRAAARVTPAGPDIGEPIARRPGGWIDRQPSRSRDGPVRPPARPPVSEQIAASRAVRRRRREWAGRSPKLGDGGLG
ncbi:MAG TPA: signal peptidase I [Candidatus Limnocylindrales bacterium]|nr:signal peptidase I [Candidatus Limnocylindrales bacterium]